MVKFADILRLSDTRIITCVVYLRGSGPTITPLTWVFLIKNLNGGRIPILLASRTPVQPALDRHLLPPHTLRLHLLARDFAAHSFVTADSRLYTAIPVYTYICARAYTAPPVVMKTLKGLTHIDQTTVVPRVVSP